MGRICGVGWVMDTVCQLIDCWLWSCGCVGAVQRHGHKQFHWTELFDLWEDRRTDDDNSKQVSK
jgi:hypothetical protein